MIDKELDNIISKELVSKKDLWKYEAERKTNQLRL